jgi:[acyl-carrier-protein] S-malonyltransferase
VAAAAERMKEALREFMIQPPAGVFIANASGKAAGQPEVIRDLLYKQISRPVRWTETLERMTTGDVDTVLEFGHGRVLTGMFKKVKRDARIFNVGDEASLAAAAEACRAL